MIAWQGEHAFPGLVPIKKDLSNLFPRECVKSAIVATAAIAAADHDDHDDDDDDGGHDDHDDDVKDGENNFELR